VVGSYAGSWFHAGNTGHIPNYPRLCSDVFGSMGWRKAQHWGGEGFLGGRG